MHVLHRAAPALVLIALVSLARCNLFDVATPGRVDIPPDLMAITHAGYSRSAAEYSLLGMLGATMSRIDLSWDLVQAQPGTFDFSAFDGVISTALGNGIAIMGILDYDVPWIHSNGQEQKYIPPDHVQDWLNYVAAVVDHYAGQVTSYEIWNEPNGQFWTGTVDEFAALTRQTAAVIREHDPTATVLAGAFWRNPNDWARAMMAEGAFRDVDAISFHPYAATAETSAQMSSDFMSYVRSLGFQGKFWITEVGFTTQGIYPWTIPDAQYPAQLVKAVTMLSVTGVEKLVWYTLTNKYLANQAPTGETLVSLAEAYFGVAYPDYTPRNGAYAYQAVAKSIQGSTYVPDLIQNFSARDWIKVYPFIRSDGRMAVVAWADLPARVEFSKQVSGALLAIDGPGTNPFSGQVLRLSSQPLVLVTDNPVGASLKLYKAAF